MDQSMECEAQVNGGISPENLPVPEIPKCLQMRSVMKGLISYTEAKKLDGYRVAAHACVWTPQEGASNFGQLHAAIMMQLRFDGTFGFAGGLINSNEEIVAGLNREMEEEIGWSQTAHPITWADYYNTNVDHDRQLVLHFFIKKLTMEQFVALEKGVPLASEYGNEVFGCVRVPLYTMANMYSGLPAFLNNKFVGTSKQQLLLTLHYLHLLTEQEINDVIYKSQNLKLAPNRL